MKQFYVRWNGTITRDCGTLIIEAHDQAEAVSTFHARYQQRKLVTIQEAPHPPNLKILPGSEL